MPIFPDFPKFRPNLTPSEIFSRGAFGGSYWRPIYSSVTCQNYHNAHLEFEFSKEISPSLLNCAIFDVKKNKYKKHSGTSLEAWESKSWIKAQDPYGWVQWYCRFYNGRRSEDDNRQIQRWCNFTGPKGRFKTRLVNMIRNKEALYDDAGISPVIRQGLLHWGYEITKEDVEG